MEYKKSVLEPKITDNFGDKALAKDALLYFCNSPLFYDNDNRYEENFYGRRIRPHVLKHINFDEPLELKDMLSYSSFAANRALFSMNDTSFYTFLLKVIYAIQTSTIFMMIKDWQQLVLPYRILKIIYSRF